MGLPVSRQLVDMVVERRGDADIHLDGTGLAVAVRGVGTAADAARWQQMLRLLSEQPTEQLRRIGGCLVVAGAVILWVLAR